MVKRLTHAPRTFKAKRPLARAGCGIFLVVLHRRHVWHAWDGCGDVNVTQSSALLLGWDLKKGSRQLSSYQITQVANNIVDREQILIVFSSCEMAIWRLFWTVLTQKGKMPTHEHTLETQKPHLPGTISLKGSE